MYVCLCMGVTSETVRDAVANGATTSKQVADACQAGTGCGRCRRTVRAIIASEGASPSPIPLWGKVKQLAHRAG